MYCVAGVTARNTKNGRPRDIPMNDEVREALAELCKNMRPDEYVFVNPKTKSSLQETKTAFHTAVKTNNKTALLLAKSTSRK
jgi:integrase